eukprot:scaffold7819_cov325-Pinguiococcus_pyrenoidosus.AAC.3
MNDERVRHHQEKNNQAVMDMLLITQCKREKKKTPGESPGGIEVGNRLTDSCWHSSTRHGHAEGHRPLQQHQDHLPSQ